MTDRQIETLAHRMCWRYKHSTDPHHSDTYTFNRTTLLDFVRAVLEQQPAHSGEPTSEDQVFTALRGVDSLDALAVWRAAEQYHNIKGGHHGPV